MSKSNKNKDGFLKHILFIIKFINLESELTILLNI